MKILMINVVCGIRSTGRICTDLADALTEQGHEVKIAYGRETVPKKYQKYAVRIGTDLDVKLHGIKARLFDACGFGSKRATEKFIEWVKDYDPDVIHLHNIHGYYINVEVLFDYLRTCGKKIIWTLHDCWAFTGHCSHFTEVKCNKWKKGCYKCPQKTSYPASFMLDNSKSNWLIKKKLFLGITNLTIVTPSKWLASLVKESFLKNYEVVVINNGIDTNVFKPIKSDFRRKCGIEDKKIILGVASSWDKNKGLDDFTELADVLDDSYIIVIVGLTKKQMKMIHPKMIGIERTDSIDELVAIYSAADVFLNPSRQETMGLTTVEAFACGTPVVVSNLTAVPEVVTSKCGVVLNEIDIQEIKNAIEGVLNTDWIDIETEALKYEKSRKYREYYQLCYKSQDSEKGLRY